MGAKCCGGDSILRQPVTYLSNQIPNSDPYKQYKATSIRFEEITVRRKNQNNFVFNMHVKNAPEVTLQLPVLNQQLYCALANNYQLKIHSKMVVDIFNKQYQSTLTDVQNQKEGSKFSMKVIPFKGYNNQALKQGLYQLWIHKKLEKAMQSRRKGNFHGNILKVADSYIFSMNQERQALVILFQQVTTSLANVAQYRLRANWLWSRQQKLFIMCQVIQSYDVLFSNNIIHRNIRPSNLFYVPRTQSFAFGNFRYARYVDKSQDDLMTVVGVPFFVEDRLQILMNKKQESGFYCGLDIDYEGLRTIINILQNCNILDKNPRFRTEQLQKLSEMLRKNQPFEKIRSYIQFVKDNLSIQYGQNIGDAQISNSAHYLLAHTHRKLIEDFTFKHFYNLGYNKHFSDMAHKMIDKNIQTNRQLDNAPLLKRLGQFYQQNGGKGNQYFYNSFALYLKNADNKIKHEMTDEAEYELQQAKNVYLKLNRGQGSQSGLIEIKRVQALILLQRNKRKEALVMMKKILTQGAEQNLPVQNQAKLLLAYAKILNGNSQRAQALKNLQNGLSICSNSVEFKSPSSCRIHKSNFLFQIGRTYLNEINKNFDPKKPKNQQNYPEQLNGQAESHLRSALQIMQNQNSSEFDIAQVLNELGYLYYLDQNFFEAKQYYKRSLIKYKSVRNQIPPIKMAICQYYYGSSCYYLNEFLQAKQAYENAIQLLKKISKEYLLRCNIQGNLGLTMMELNQWESGKKLFMESLQNIKRLKTQHSYDYVALLANYKKIKSPPQHSHRHHHH